MIRDTQMNGASQGTVHSNNADGNTQKICPIHKR